MKSDDLPPEILNQFKQDHLAELWDDMELMIGSRNPISGEDFLTLELEEQVSLLKEAAQFLNAKNPIDPQLLDSYLALVRNLPLPQETKGHLQQITVQ